MPGKGRAEHGGGAAKWRHGWIPANAAARAIVAAREAQKHTVTRHDASRPTEEDSSPGVVDEKTQTLLRSPDEASGTPSLFRGRRNIVDSAPPPFLGKMAHIEGPHSAEDDSVNANPGYYTTKQGILGFDDRESLRQHQVNCYNCVQAYELRRRGYAVQAVPAQLNWYGGSGKTEEEIAAGWKTADGQNAQFMAMRDSNAVMTAIDGWPSGSRGWISNSWKSEPTGHVYAWEKNDQGDVHFYDPQPGGEVSDYFDRSNPQMALMRTDNLAPTETIGERVEPSSTIAGTWRPSKREMGTPLTKTPEMKKWLNDQISQTFAQMEKIPDTPNRKWDRDVLQARFNALQLAKGFTATELQDYIVRERSVEEQFKGQELTQDEQNSLRLITVKRILAEQILHKAVPNATGILVSGVPVTPGKKAEKRWRQ